MSESINELNLGVVCKYTKVSKYCKLIKSKLDIIPVLTDYCTYQNHITLPQHKNRVP